MIDLTQCFRKCLLFYLSFYCSTISAQELVKDINPSKAGSNPSGLNAGSNGFVFKANSLEYGLELFFSDGTMAGTTIFQDHVPGVQSGNIINHEVIGSHVYTVTKSAATMEFWKIDLVSQTPMLLISLPSNIGVSSSDDVFTQVGNEVYFYFWNNSYSFELWKTDGTPGNTVLVDDLGQNAFPKDFQALDNILYFTKYDFFTGRELWRSDGTAGGTFLVKNASAGTDLEDVLDLTVFQGKLYYSVIQPFFKFEIWESDGTEAGTQLLTGNNAFEITVVGNSLFFTVSDPISGAELWKMEGTAQQLTLVKDIVPGAGLGILKSLVASGTKLYFIADDGVSGSELWTSDGTSTGTYLVKDIRSGTAGSFQQNLFGATVGNTFYFVADDGIHGEELWKTDGSSGTTQLVKDIFPGTSFSFPASLISFNNKVYFTATDELEGRELFGSDGTANGTQIVKSLNPVSSSSSPGGLWPLHDKLIFSAATINTGFELWATDGTAGNTQLVADIYPGMESSYPFFKTAMGNDLYMVANNPDYGLEIWKTDGTSAGTSLLKDIGSGTFGSSTKGMVTLDNKVLFGAFTPAEGEELWVTDGTENGTVLLKDLFPGEGQSFPYFENKNYTFNGQKNIHFSATIPKQGTMLLKSDGTSAGTETLTLLGPEYTGGFSGGAQTGDIVLFAQSYLDGELWRTSGIPNGTFQLKEIVQGPAPSNPGNFTVFQNKVYFTAKNSQTGTDLWVSDGTLDGTLLVKELNPAGGIGAISELINFNDQLLVFNLASDGLEDIELWASDGTEAGTHLIKDIRPGSAPSYPRYLTVLGDKVFFAADDGEHGRELWQTDGTEAGTIMVSDLNAGILGSEPESFRVFKDKLYFSANNGIWGAELWRYPSGNSSVNTILPSEKVKIFPNPTMGVFNADFGQEGSWDVTMVTPLGMQVAAYSIAGRIGQIDTGSLPAGLYLLKCRNTLTETTLVSRVQVVRR